VNVQALQEALLATTEEDAFNPFGDGRNTTPAVIERLRARGLYTLRSTLQSWNLTAHRELGHFQGGAGQLSIGVDYRKQIFDSTTRSTGIQEPLAYRRHRGVKAFFGELLIPVARPAEPWRALERLDLSLSLRHEDYDDFGRTNAPQAGFVWKVMPQLAIRGTWSRSYKPPTLANLDEAPNIVTLIPLAAAPTDPPAYALAVIGKNSTLHEERAKSYTFGADIELPALPGFSLGLTYFNIAFTGRIREPLPSADMLTDPRYQELITTDFTPADRQAICSKWQLSGLLPSGCLSAPISAIADLRLRNDESLRTNGVDLVGKYSRDTRIGAISFGFNGSYVFSFRQQAGAETAPEELVSTQWNPMDFRYRASTGWRRWGIDANLFVNYMDGYRDVANVPQRHVGSWTTVDLNVAYTTDPYRGAWLAGTEFSLGVENLADRDPPFMNNVRAELGYDQENADLTGRMLSFTVRKRW
jgi:iron complex outermembrane receptor protein